jgi:hypothetical protein
MAAAQEEIITKEKGSQKVKSEGIDPFLNFINSGARDFFSAQVFVTLYESVTAAQPWRGPAALCPLLPHAWRLKRMIRSFLRRCVLFAPASSSRCAFR